MAFNRMAAGLDVIYLAGCAANGIVPDLMRVKAMDLEAVFAAGCFCGLSAIVCTAVESALESAAENGPETADPDQSDCLSGSSVLPKWKSERDRAVYTDTMFDAERERVLNFLEEAGIGHMLLKGVVLKGCYPGIGMRQMVDNDILIDGEHRERVREWFLERGYRADKYNEGNHDVYLKSPCYNFEMHVSLFGLHHDPEWYEYYKDLSDRMIPDPGYSFRYHFSDEDFYIYLITHYFKHYHQSGIGIRSILDCYLYLKAAGDFEDSMNREYITRELCGMGAERFEERMTGLARKLFDNPERFRLDMLDPEEVSFLEELLASGTSGTIENLVKTGIRDAGGDVHNVTSAAKMRYILRRLFPDPREVMSFFPAVERHKILLPIGYAARFVRGFKTNRGKWKAELKAMRKM